MNANNDHLPATARSADSKDSRAALSDRVRSLRLAERSPEKRSGGGGFLPWALAIVLLLTTVVFGYKAFWGEPVTRVQIADAAVREGGGAPTTAAPAGTSGEVAHEATGYVIAAHQIQISPQVGGEIVWLDPRFKEGAIYQKGERLAEIDPVIYAAQLKSAQAALAVAQTNLQQVESGSTLKEIEAMEAQVKNLAAKLEMAQLDEKYNRAAGTGASRSDLEKSIVQVKIDQAAYESQRQTLAKLKVSLEEQRQVCKAQVQKSQADVEQATKQLKNCTIVAPTTGIVLSKKAELGGYVNPLAFGAAGYLCEMADLGDLEVDLAIQERDIDKVFAGQECTIQPKAFTDSESFKKVHPVGYHGRVSRLMPVADRSKGSVSVRVAIDKEQIPPGEAGFFLRPDMSVLVWFKKAK
jgi:multidrug resistance efflux pump